MSDHQKFTPEQLERIESAVNFAVEFNDETCRPGTAVKDILRNQDLKTARSGPIISVETSSAIGFLQLPAEIRNKIYRYCLVVGEVYPRPKPLQDDRLKDRSKYQQPQTQVFQLCRQIFAEAAPLYFAENKFILSYGLLPWAHYKVNLESKPITRVAHQHLKALSITFDVRDCQILPSCLQTNRDDEDFEQRLITKWHKLIHLLEYLDLELLEVYMQNCYCAFCHRRMVDTIEAFLWSGIRQYSARVIFKGLIDSDEVTMIREQIDRTDFRCAYFNLPDRTIEFEDEDPNDNLQIAFRVTKR